MAVVNELSMFESLKFCCSSLLLQIHCVYLVDVFLYIFIVTVYVFEMSRKKTGPIL